MFLKIEKANMAVLELSRGGWRNEILFSYGRPVACVDRLQVYVTGHDDSRTTAKHVNEFLRTFGDRGEAACKKDRKTGERQGAVSLPNGFFLSPFIGSESPEDRRIRADCWIEYGRDPSPDDFESDGETLIKRYARRLASNT